MSFALIARIQGFLLLFLGAAMCVPVLIALLCREVAWQGLLGSACCTVIAGATLIFSCRAVEKQISQREGFLIVAIGWILASLFGSLPFFVQGYLPSFTDAFFETVSGFTTTGATVISNVEALPRAVLFWRSMIQWLGGMGIILFSIAIVPLLGIGGMQLYKAEVPGPVIEKIKPRIAETARSLWKVYILLSLGQTLLLMLCGMDVYEAVCHTFTTMATGGFSTRNKSIESFGNPWIELIVIVFMVAAGINFTLHYHLLHGRVSRMFRDREFQFYCAVLCLATLLVTQLLCMGSRIDMVSALRQACFQAVSIMTTTGYSTCNFDVWPSAARFILLMLMLIGGCAGSTGGGIKCIRVLLLCKQIYRELFCMVHPNAVVSIKLAGKPVPETVLRPLTHFILVYLMVWATGTAALTWCGLDMVTALSSAAATLGNIGPGLAGVGPYETFAWIPPPGKWILIMLMLFGRLELFTLLLIFVPAFWKK
ncbi:MAG: TrkH family potassium uptake protein [Desulfobacterota bacterium]|nr:TrkH family potassium uptake protein [Thermodesulfobacteriota bacterium]